MSVIALDGGRWVGQSGGSEVRTLRPQHRSAVQMMTENMQVAD